MIGRAPDHAVDGVRALVTGASSGIGREIARALAGRGARVALAARREDRLRELAEGIEAGGSPRPVVLPADLSRRGEAAALGERAADALGGVDLLVNNAGVGVGGTQWRVADGDEAREMLETNLWSPLALVGALVPAMRERDAGAVVNVTSLSQVMPWGGMGHYSLSKAALASATETLRLELLGTGVHVLEVVAGPTDTAIQGESRLVPGFADATRRAPLGRPEQLARLVVRGLERGRKRIVYPRSLAPFYTLPFLVRRSLPRMARRYADAADDERVLRAGSGGDPAVLAAREEWERSQGGA